MYDYSKIGYVEEPIRVVESKTSKQIAGNIITKCRISHAAAKEVERSCHYDAQ